MSNAVAFILAVPLFIFVQLFGWKFGFLLFVAAAVGLVVAMIWKTNANKEHQIEVLRSCINKHFRELALKHRQLTFSGAYGMIDSTKWIKEQNRFIDMVFAPEVGGRAAVAISEDTMRSVIDEEVNKANTGGRKVEVEALSESASGIDYELHCTKLLQKCGWDARMTVATGDQGCDIVATKFEKKLVVQCKYYSGNVGNSAVQQAAAGRAYYEADIAVVISNAGYTKAAKQLAKSLDIRLLHHDDIPSIETEMANVS